MCQLSERYPRPYHFEEALGVDGLYGGSAAEAIAARADRFVCTTAPARAAMRSNRVTTNRSPPRIVQPHADWGVTLEMIASQAGLGCLPMQEVRYDFVVPRSRTTRPGVIAFTTLLARPSTRDALRRLGMRIKPSSRLRPPVARAYKYT